MSIVRENLLTRAHIGEVAADPVRARAFLQDAGILDDTGALAEPYRTADAGVAASQSLSVVDLLRQAREFIDTVHDGEYGYSECTRDELVEKIDAALAHGVSPTALQTNPSSGIKTKKVKLVLPEVQQ